MAKRSVQRHSCCSMHPRTGTNTRRCRYRSGRRDSGSSTRCHRPRFPSRRRGRRGPYRAADGACRARRTLRRSRPRRHPARPRNADGARRSLLWTVWPWPLPLCLLGESSPNVPPRSRGVEHESGGTDHARVVAERRLDHADRAGRREHGTRDGALGGLAIEREVPLARCRRGSGEHFGQERVDEAPDRRFHRVRAAGDDGLCGLRAGLGRGEDGLGVGVAELRACPRERRPCGERLEAAPASAVTVRAGRVDDQMADLGMFARGAPQDRAIDQRCAADAGADRSA